MRLCRTEWVSCALLGALLAAVLVGRPLLGLVDERARVTAAALERSARYAPLVDARGRPLVAPLAGKGTRLPLVHADAARRCREEAAALRAAAAAGPGDAADLEARAARLDQLALAEQADADRLEAELGPRYAIDPLYVPDYRHLGLGAELIYSVGPNGRDELGHGDDVVLLGLTDPRLFVYQLLPQLCALAAGLVALMWAAARLAPPARTPQGELRPAVGAGLLVSLAFLWARPLWVQGAPAWAAHLEWIETSARRALLGLLLGLALWAVVRLVSRTALRGSWRFLIPSLAVAAAAQTTNDRGEGLAHWIAAMVDLGPAAPAVPGWLAVTASVFALATLAVLFVRLDRRRHGADALQPDEVRRRSGGPDTA